MNVQSCRRPNRLKRFVASVWRRCETCVPLEWPGEPPPDIGVREPRRPKPGSGTGSALLDPPL